MLSYSIGWSLLGAIAMAWSEKGIVAVSVGDSEAQAEHTLLADIDRPVQRIASHEEARHWQHWLPILLHSQPCALDINGTAFQHSVWRALLDIPYGETRSYRDIAMAIGQPTAIRAVANACGANPISLIIPCHRVIRHNGELGGYRWGSERKRWLLAREQSRQFALTG